MSGGFQISRDQPTQLVLLRGYDKPCLCLSNNLAEFLNHPAVDLLASPLFPVLHEKAPNQPFSPRAFHFFISASAEDTFSAIARLLEVPGLQPYLTLGNAELICAHDASVDIDTVRRLQDEVNIKIETWEVEKDGSVTGTVRPELKQPEGKEQLDCSKVLPLVPPDAGYLAREFLNLVIRRRDGALVSMRREMPPTQSYLDRLVIALEENAEDSDRYEVLWRFAGAHTYSVTQRFTCLTPVTDSPCPIGGFELLGLGKGDIVKCWV